MLVGPGVLVGGGGGAGVLVGVIVGVSVGGAVGVFVGKGGVGVLVGKGVRVGVGVLVGVGVETGVAVKVGRGVPFTSAVGRAAAATRRSSGEAKVQADVNVVISKIKLMANFSTVKTANQPDPGSDGNRWLDSHLVF